MQNILSVFFPKNKHPQLQNCGLNHFPRPKHAKQAAPDFNTYTLNLQFLISSHSIDLQMQERMARALPL